MDYSLRLLFAFVSMWDRQAQFFSAGLQEQSVQEEPTPFPSSPTAFRRLSHTLTPIFTPRWHDSPVLCGSTQRYGTHMHAKAEISEQLTRASTSVPVLCDSSTESPAWCSSSQTTELHPSSVFQLYFVAPWHAASSSHADRQAYAYAPGSNKPSRASEPGWLTEKIKKKKKRGSPSSHEQKGFRVLCQVLGTRFQPSKKRNRAQRVCTRVRLNMKAADGVLSNHGW